MEGIEEKRDFGLDAVRAAAGILTLSVHFFMNSGFYEAPVVGKAMLAACVLRTLCMTCVPLFLILTGYTCIGRRWSKGYYRKLLPILFTYLLAGAVCMVFRAFVRENGFSLMEVVTEFTTFNASPYGWYIEMYIGLFLLSPFFNAAWHALEENEKKVLVLTLVGMTALPWLVNQGVPLLPTWWEGIYPLTYYALGAWLREHPVPVRYRGWQLLLCCFGLTVAVGMKGCWNAGGASYVLMPEDRWSSLTLTIQAVCLFSCLQRVTGERLPATVRWCVARVARLALPMYLVSFVSDWVVYRRLAQSVPVIQRRLFWMPAAVGTSLVCSLALAQLIDWAARALTGLVPMKKREAANAQSRE